MGRRKGVFITRAGELISVTFEGDKVANSDAMLFGESPILLTMTGKAGDFEPVKHTSGTITLVVQGDDECRDLMTVSPLEVSVRVFNETKRTVVFAGYVSPHTYNQDVGSYTKEVSVEVVDWLGACKMLPYMPYSSGFSIFSVHEMIMRINSLYFRKVKEVKWPATLHVIAAKEPPAIIADERFSPLYFLAEVCDSAFFDGVDAYSQRIADGDLAGEVLFPRKSVTCYDVLAAIGNSFLFTLVQIGESWVWLDAVAVRESQELSYYTSTGDGGFALDGSSSQVATSVVRADEALLLSSVEKFERISIANGYEDGVQLLPTFADENQLQLLGDVQMTTSGSGIERKTYMWQRAKHLCYDTLAVEEIGGGTRGSELIVYRDASSAYRANPVLGAPFSGTTPWQTTLVAYLPPSADDYTTILRQTAYTNALPQCAGIGVKINMSLAAAKGVCQLPTSECDYIGADEWVNSLYLLVECGGRYYYHPGVADSQTGELAHWLPYKVYNRVVFKGGSSATSEWYVEGRQDENMQMNIYTDIVVVNDLRDTSYPYSTVGGSVNIELCVKGGYGSKQTTLFISDFGAEVRLSRDKYYTLPRLAANAGKFLRTGVGRGERSPHELPLSYMWQCSRGLLSTVVGGVDCATLELVQLLGGKFHISNTCLGYTLGGNYDSRYGSSLARLAKLVNGGEAYSIEVAVDEAEGPTVSPLSRVAVAGVEGCVVSIERDVQKCVASIVIL